jgi:hypothetical protein
MSPYDLAPLSSMSEAPRDPAAFDAWIQQLDVAPFLIKDATEEYIILYASFLHIFVHGLLIPNHVATPGNVDELQHWRHNPSCSLTSISIDEPCHDAGTDLLADAQQILFRRSFDGDDSTKAYFELFQPIAHVLDIHFVATRKAWCRLNSHGDLEDIVSIHTWETHHEGLDGTVVLIKREALAEYAGILGLTFLRVFDFTRFRLGDFQGWPERDKVTEVAEADRLWGKLVVSTGYGSYFRGVQFIDVAADKADVTKRFWSSGSKAKSYVTFTAFDWKHNRVAEISCNPECLANYFTKSDLPYEVTPAFFRPEVMLKHKSDRTKYQLDERSISCRGAWHLETFDVNGAGQVHTYLCYLANLPYEEQLHWKQYNEVPKAPLSARAIKTDFDGQFYDEYDPLPELKHRLRALDTERCGWWVLRDRSALGKVHYPFTSSREEWGDEVLYLDQLLIEGFEQRWLSNRLVALGGTSDPKHRALKLAEACLVQLGYELERAHEVMNPFHEVHNLRSIIKGHAWGTNAKMAANEALSKYRTFRAHFTAVCQACDESIAILAAELN